MNRRPHDYESYDWSSSDAITAALGTHGDVTVSVVTGGGDGNVSGHWYKSLNAAIDGAGGTYLQISSAKQIDKISVFYCPNGTNATNLAWAAWGNGVTPSAEVGSNYGITTGTTGTKSWDAAVWEDIDLSEKSAYTVRISRQIKNLTNGGNKISNAGKNQTVNLLGFKVWLKPSAPTITQQPQSASYITGYAAAAMHVAATASAGELSYQWYRCNDADKNGSSAISGEAAKAASYTPSTASAGTFYYYCVVTDGNGSTASDVATITVSAAAAPHVTISADPEGEIVTGTAVTLTATITAGNPTPTLQWYSNTTNTTSGASVISGETSETYTPDTSTPGTKYYFAVGHNTEGDNPSNILAVVVKDKVATPTFTPNGAYFDAASQSVTIDCKTDGATIQYSTDNGNTWNDYSAAFNVTETTTIKAKATKDGCFDSDVASATFTKVTLTPQVNVTGATTWNWADVTNTSAVDFTGTALNGADVTFANISACGFTAVEGLAAQDALLMNGQYAYREANGSKFTQTNYLKFNTTVSGTVTVEYANTGNNAARTVNVNGTKGSESTTVNNSYQSESFVVAVGEVTIKGVQVSDDADKMLRIRKVVFTPLDGQDVVEIGQYEWATLVNANDLDFTGSNVKAYIVTGHTGNAITLTQINKVKAGTPILLNAAKGSYVIPTSFTGDADVNTGNLLVAGPGSNVISKPDKTRYVLSAEAGVAVFKKINATDAFVPKDKAYLEFAEVIAAPMLSMGGETTGINAVNGEGFTVNGSVYDLQGRRVAQPTKGLYIVNGKKYVIK